MAGFIYPTKRKDTVSETASPSTAATAATHRTSRKAPLVLYGEDINSNTAPAHTADAVNRPLVQFWNDTRTQTFGLSERALSTHLLMMGGIGSGKTNTMYLLLDDLLPKLTRDDLVIIFDSKGDFHEKFHRDENPKHVVIGNHPDYNGTSYAWNIFDELKNADGTYDSSSELSAREIAKTLFEGRESSNQPFFSLAAADMVAKVLIHFFRHRKSELNNKALVEFFMSANVDAYHKVIDTNPDFESARDYFGPAGSKLTPQALGVLSYITTMVNDVFVGIFKEDRPGRGFAMRDFVRRKDARVVFIEYDLNAGEVMAPIYGLLYDLALKEALGGRNHKGNTYFFCDEFRILPKLKHINDALNLGRSLGVKVVAGLQTINQLYDVYGEELGKTIAAGFMNSFCFPTWDLDSREFISNRFGKNYTMLELHSMGQPVPVQRDSFVVEDWDILDLDVGEAFVNLNREHPFRFRFEEYKG